MLSPLAGAGEALGGANQVGWRMRRGADIERFAAHANDRPGPAVRAVRFVERVKHDQGVPANKRTSAKLTGSASRLGRVQFQRIVMYDNNEPHERQVEFQVAQLPDDESPRDDALRREILTPFGEEPAVDDFDLGREMDEEAEPLDMLDPFQKDVETFDEPDELDLMRELELPDDMPDLEDDIQQLPVPTDQERAQPPLFDESDLPAFPTPTLPSELTVEDERRLTEQLCDEELADLKASTLADVELNISVAGTEGSDYPFECSIESGEVLAPRGWSRVNYMWMASALYHKPLYFEEVELERYGHSWGPCLQPIVSGAHFFSRLPVLPYCMGYTPPSECMYTLGHYRPGSCAPYFIPAVPISTRAGLIQAGAVVGAAAILP